MALDFGVLQNINPVNAFFRGQEDVAQNRLAQQKMVQDQEINALRRQESELGLQRTRGLMQQEEEAQKNAKLNQKISGFKERILRARTPEDARKIVQMQYSDADISPVVSQYATLEQALAEVPDDPNEFRTYLNQEAMGIDEWIKSQAQAQQKELIDRNKLSERRFINVGGGLVFDTLNEQYVQPPSMSIGRAPRAAAPTRESAGVAAPTELLTLKERQKREADFPKATTALKGFETKTDTLIEELRTLKNHPGLDSITGLIAGRIPGVTSAGREAEALHDKITARGQFQELENMRNASPTGGALGNVSNTEGEKLKASFAALDRRQDAKSVQKAIDAAILQLTNSKGLVRDAYDMTYEYRQPSAAPSAPAKPAATGNLTPAEQAELDQLRKRFGK